MNLAHFTKHILLYSIIPLLILTIAASFYRFIIAQDYLVSYEGECDPQTESCFVECEDEECTTEYYYSIVERHANEIHTLCGEDITDCEAANYCPINSENCSVTYCVPESDADACEVINTSS